MICRLLLAFDHAYEAASEGGAERTHAGVYRADRAVPRKATGWQLDQEDYLQLPRSSEWDRSERVALGK